MTIEKFIEKELSANKDFLPPNLSFSIYFKDKKVNSFNKHITFIFNMYFPYKSKESNERLLLDILLEKDSKEEAYISRDKDNRCEIVIHKDAIKKLEKGIGFNKADTMSFVLWHECGHAFQYIMVPNLDKILEEMYADCFSCFMATRGASEEERKTFCAYIADFRSRETKYSLKIDQVQKYDTQYALNHFMKNMSNIKNYEDLNLIIIESCNYGSNKLHQYHSMIHDTEFEDSLVSYLDTKDNCNRYNYFVEVENRVYNLEASIIEGIKKDFNQQLKENYSLKEVADILVHVISWNYIGLTQKETAFYKTDNYKLKKETLIETFQFKSVLGKIRDYLFYKPNKLIEFNGGKSVPSARCLLPK